MTFFIFSQSGEKNVAFVRTCHGGRGVSTGHDLTGPLAGGRAGLMRTAVSQRRQGTTVESNVREPC